MLSVETGTSFPVNSSITVEEPQGPSALLAICSVTLLPAAISTRVVRADVL